MNQAVSAPTAPAEILDYRDPSLWPDLTHIITEDDAPVEPPRRKTDAAADEPLYASWPGPGDNRPFRVLSNVGLFNTVSRPPLVPDVMLGLDMPHARRPDGQGPSGLVRVDCRQEAGRGRGDVSNQEGGEDTDKLGDYATIGVPYYIIHDPKNLLSKGVLRGFALREGSYEPIDPRWLPKLGLGLVLWSGRYEDVEEQWFAELPRRPGHPDRGGAPGGSRATRGPAAQRADQEQQARAAAENAPHHEQQARAAAEQRRGNRRATRRPRTTGPRRRRAAGRATGRPTPRIGQGSLRLKSWSKPDRSTTHRQSLLFPPLAAKPPNRSEQREQSRGVSLFCSVGSCSRAAPGHVSRFPTKAMQRLSRTNAYYTSKYAARGFAPGPHCACRRLGPASVPARQALPTLHSARSGRACRPRSSRAKPPVCLLATRRNSGHAEAPAAIQLEAGSRGYPAQLPGRGRTNCRPGSPGSGRLQRCPRTTPRRCHAYRTARAVGLVRAHLDGRSRYFPLAAFPSGCFPSKLACWRRDRSSARRGRSQTTDCR